MNLEEEKILFLEKFLKNVPFDGWSEKCLESTSISLEKNQYYYCILFPRGLSDIMIFFSEYIDEKMEQSLQENDISATRVRDKIHFLIMTRLKCYTPYKEAIRKLVKTNYTFAKISHSLKMLWKTSDSFWYKIGDNSTDYNYYTKRFLLSCIYSRTLLHWLADKSENNEATFVFLDHEIERILKLGNIKKNFLAISEKIKKIPFIRLLVKKKRD